MKNVQMHNCITQEEVKELILSKLQRVKIIDVRSKKEYEESHIQGAINIEVSEIALAVKCFDKKDFILTACGKGGGRSAEAAEKLRKSGFENSSWICGGTFGWSGSLKG